MQVAVLHGDLSEAEQDYYVRQVTAEFPISIVEKVSYTLHRFRDLRKMGGCCIGEPSSWNYAKQAELRDTIPNQIDF